MNTILNTNYEDLVFEIKVATICFKNAEKGKLPMPTIAARLQQINEVLSFADNIYKVVSLVVKKFKNISFTNFETDWVSVETREIITILFKFFNRKLNYAARVDNKHNVKNYCYQYIGGPNVTTIGMYF